MLELKLRLEGVEGTQSFIFDELAPLYFLGYSLILGDTVNYTSIRIGLISVEFSPLNAELALAYEEEHSSYIQCLVLLKRTIVHIESGSIL